MEATAALSELERVQIQILRRISDLELRVGLTHSPSPVTTADNNAPAEANLSGHTTEARLSNILLENGVKDFKFKRVSFDYYNWTLDSRRDALGAASIDHLCKSIVMVHIFYIYTLVIYFVHYNTLNSRAIYSVFGIIFCLGLSCP